MGDEWKRKANNHRCSAECVLAIWGSCRTRARSHRCARTRKVNQVGSGVGSAKASGTGRWVFDKDGRWKRREMKHDRRRTDAGGDDERRGS